MLGSHDRAIFYEHHEWQILTDRGNEVMRVKTSLRDLLSFDTVRSWWTYLIRRRDLSLFHCQFRYDNIRTDEIV